MKKADDGEVTSFGALCTALSATIGTGNIVGVATAIAAGGPGALVLDGRCCILRNGNKIRRRPSGYQISYHRRRMVTFLADHFTILKMVWENSGDG